MAAYEHPFRLVTITTRLQDTSSVAYGEINLDRFVPLHSASLPTSLLHPSKLHDRDSSIHQTF